MSYRVTLTCIFDDWPVQGKWDPIYVTVRDSTIGAGFAHGDVENVVKVERVSHVDNHGDEDEHVEEAQCCECGEPDHTCQFCPVFLNDPDHPEDDDDDDTDDSDS